MAGVDYRVSIMFRSSPVTDYPMAARALPAAGLDIITNILVAIAVLTTLVGGPALAADLPPPAPAAPPPPVLSSPSWSGPYLGIGIGTRFNAVDANVTSATVGTPPTPIPLPAVSSGSSNPLAFWQQN